jgi:hypothetical protein
MSQVDALERMRLDFVKEVSPILHKHDAFRSGRRVAGVAVLPVQVARQESKKQLKAWLTVEKTFKHRCRFNLTGGSTVDHKKNRDNPTPEEVAGTLFDETYEELCVAWESPAAFIASVSCILEIPYYRTVSLVFVLHVSSMINAGIWLAEHDARMQDKVPGHFVELNGFQAVDIPKSDNWGETTPYARMALQQFYKLQNNMQCIEKTDAMDLSALPIVQVRANRITLKPHTKSCSYDVS